METGRLGDAEAGFAAAFWSAEAETPGGVGDTALGLGAVDAGGVVVDFAGVGALESGVALTLPAALEDAPRFSAAAGDSTFFGGALGGALGPPSAVWDAGTADRGPSALPAATADGGPSALPPIMTNAPTATAAATPRPMKSGALDFCFPISAF